MTLLFLDASTSASLSIVKYDDNHYNQKFCALTQHHLLHTLGVCFITWYNEALLGIVIVTVLERILSHGYECDKSSQVARERDENRRVVL